MMKRRCPRGHLSQRFCPASPASPDTRAILAIVEVRVDFMLGALRKEDCSSPAVSNGSCPASLFGRFFNTVMKREMSLPAKKVSKNFLKSLKPSTGNLPVEQSWFYVMTTDLVSLENGSCRGFIRDFPSELEFESDFASADKLGQARKRGNTQARKTSRK